MSREVGSEVDVHAMSSSELLKLRDELEAQIGFGAMCRRACTPKSEKESKEKMSKKRTAEAKMACGVGVTKRPNEMKMKELPSAEGKGRKKVVTWRLSQELLEYLRTKEVMGYMATETPREGLVRIPEELWDPELREEIAAEFNKNREFDAHVLFQYRSKGYAEISEDDEEVSSGEGKRQKMLPKVVDFSLREELVRYMLCKSRFPAPHTEDYFGPDMDRRISALIKERKVMDAHILREYRTNGYVCRRPTVV